MKTCLDCGETKELTEFYQTQNVCKSCNCKKITNYYKNDLEKYLWQSAKRRSRLKDLEFSISPEDIHIPEYCPLLGIKLMTHLGENTGKGRGKGRMHDDTITLDRINNKEGYTVDNIWVVSHKANVMMNTGTWQELAMISEGLRKKIESMDKKQLDMFDKAT